MDKLNQYSAFVKNFFLSPDAGVNFTAVNHVSWQLNTVAGINFVGIAILLLSIVSAVMNRDKKSILLAAGWISFSVFMLVIFGYGTRENGLILYALYFGWAFLVLLFQLIEKIENKLNVKFLIPAVTVVCIPIMAMFNIPAITEMISFAVTYFPV